MASTALPQYSVQRGRVSKFTPEIKQKLLQAIRLGNRYKTACQYAGIDYATLRNWLLRGEKASMLNPDDIADEDLDYVAFFEAMAEAEASAEMTAVAHWRSQFSADWKASRDFLARRYPDGWGAKVEVNITHTDEQILELLTELTDGEQQVIEAQSRELPAQAVNAFQPQD